MFPALRFRRKGVQATRHVERAYTFEVYDAIRHFKRIGTAPIFVSSFALEKERRNPLPCAPMVCKLPGGSAQAKCCSATRAGTLRAKAKPSDCLVGPCQAPNPSGEQRTLGRNVSGVTKSYAQPGTRVAREPAPGARARADAFPNPHFGVGI